MLLYTNGCSHTDGTPECLGEEPRLKVWPTQLFRMLTDNKDGTHHLLNVAISGNVNSNIASTTVRDLCQPDVYKPDYAVIQFTYPTRFWTPKQDNGEDLDHINEPYTGQFHSPNGYETVMKSIEDNPKFSDPRTAPKNKEAWYEKHYNNLNFYKQYYMNYGSQVSATTQMFSEVKLVETFLQAYDIPYTFIIWPRVYAPNYDYKVLQSIDHSRVLNYDHGEYFDLDRMLPTHGYEFPIHVVSQHYEEPGQRFLAKAVYKHITNNTKLSPAHKMKPAPDKFIDSLY